jgi:hypothetical protein
MKTYKISLEYSQDVPLVMGHELITPYVDNIKVEAIDPSSDQVEVTFDSGIPFMILFNLFNKINFDGIEYLMYTFRPIEFYSREPDTSLSFYNFSTIGDKQFCWGESATKYIGATAIKEHYFYYRLNCWVVLVEENGIVVNHTIDFPNKLISGHKWSAKLNENISTRKAKNLVEKHFRRFLETMY